MHTLQYQIEGGLNKRPGVVYFLIFANGGGVKLSYIKSNVMIRTIKRLGVVKNLKTC